MKVDRASRHGHTATLWKLTVDGGVAVVALLQGTSGSFISSGGASRNMLPNLEGQLWSCHQEIQTSSFHPSPLFVIALAFMPGSHTALRLEPAIQRPEFASFV
ncbi:hypothetical protein CC78DRAFT_530238, partial [Lojkania enalia]